MSFFGIFLASSKPLTAYLDLTILLIYETNISCILKEVYQNVSKHFFYLKFFPEQFELHLQFWKTIAVEIQDDSWSCFVTVEA